MRHYGHFKQTVAADVKTEEAGLLISDSDTKTFDTSSSIHQSIHLCVASSIYQSTQQERTFAFQVKNNLMTGIST